MQTFGRYSFAMLRCYSSLSFRTTLRFQSTVGEISQRKSQTVDGTWSRSSCRMLSCRKRGLSSPQAIANLPQLHRGNLSPRADPGLALGFLIFSTMTQSSKLSSNSSLCCMAATSWMGTKFSMIMLTSLSSLTMERFSCSSSSRSCTMKSWMSLLASQASLSLLFNLASCLRRCSTCSLRVRFFSVQFYRSMFFWFSYSSSRRSCCLRSSSSFCASQFFFSSSRASSLTRLPWRSFSFIYFSLSASYSCFCFYCSFCWSASCFLRSSSFLLSRSMFMISFFCFSIFSFYFSRRELMSFFSFRTFFSTITPSIGSLPYSIFFSFSIYYWYSRIMASLGSSFIFGLFFIFLASEAQRRVDMVYSQLQLAGPTLAIMIVLAFPPRDSCRSLVSFESLQGMWAALELTRDLMTCPRVESAKLMQIPSLERLPVACVFFWRSEPARSTRLSLPALILLSPFTISSCYTRIMKMQWEREDFSFMSVDPVCLFLLPSTSLRFISSTVVTITALRSFTQIPLSLSSCNCSLCPSSFENRSTISSLQSSSMETLTRNCTPGVPLMALMMCANVRGMMPSWLGYYLLPSIVWVLPVPVWPYAKIVPLQPQSTLYMMGRAACLKMRYCRQPGSKVRSKLKTRYFSPTYLGLLTRISPRSDATRTMDSNFYFCYLEDIGLQRTATFTHSRQAIGSIYLNQCIMDGGNTTEGHLLCSDVGSRLMRV